MKSILSLLSMLCLALFINSCVDQNFDEPPTENETPSITANTTITALRAKHTTGNYEEITEDLIVEGVVIADDQSGNFYKTMVIQDATGGIDVQLDVTDYYTKFPIGRKVYIKCKGLFLGDYNNLIQLGGGIDNSGTTPRLGRIPSSLIDQYIIGGASNQTITPITVNIADLNNTHMSRLIKLEGVQFSTSSVNKTYGNITNPASPQSVNHQIEDCDGNTIILRSSGFADFAGTTTPDKKGSLTAVYSVFRTDKQLFIRDLGDVAMTADRCSVVPGGGDFNETFDGTTINTDIALQGWQNYIETGERKWGSKSFSGNKYAQITSFQSTAAANKVWLITPAFTVTTAKKLSFDSSIAFYKHDGLTCKISKNYSGTGDPNAATWTTLSATYPAASSANYTFVNSGEISLAPHAGGTAYIAFIYEGTAANNTTTVQLDNIKVY